MDFGGHVAAASALVGVEEGEGVALSAGSGKPEVGQLDSQLAASLA